MDVCCTSHLAAQGITAFGEGGSDAVIAYLSFI